jgi:hypothetical protein
LPPPHRQPAPRSTRPRRPQNTPLRQPDHQTLPMIKLQGMHEAGAAACAEWGSGGAPEAAQGGRRSPTIPTAKNEGLPRRPGHRGKIYNSGAAPTTLPPRGVRRL